MKGGDLRVFSLQSGENDVATSAWTIVTIECVGGIAADTNIVVMTVTVGIGGRGRRRRWRWSCGYYSDARHGGRSLMLIVMDLMVFINIPASRHFRQTRSAKIQS